MSAHTNSSSSPSSTSPLHVVFGTGQIGLPLAEKLVAAGHRVRLVSRNPPPLPGVKVRAGSALDADFCREVARGADVLYHCMNAPYRADVWAEQLPRMQDNVVSAAAHAGARVVVLDNLYSLGRCNPSYRNDSPLVPCSKKGEVRAALSRSLFEAHARGDVVAVSGRAADFFGPRIELGVLDPRSLKRVREGKSGQLLVDPDMPHDFSFSEDVVSALFTLGHAPESAMGHAWNLPVLHDVTPRLMLEALGRACGHANVGVTRVPSWVLNAGAWVVPLLREMREMLYQFEAPFLVDDSAFVQQFGVKPTSLDDAARIMAAWMERAWFAPARVAA